MLVCSLCSPLSSPSKRDPPTEVDESTGTEIARQAVNAMAEARTALLLGCGRPPLGVASAGGRSGDGLGSVANPMPYSNSRWKASRLGNLSLGVVWRARPNADTTRDGRIKLSRVVALGAPDVLVAAFLSQSNACVGVLRLSTARK